MNLTEIVEKLSKFKRIFISGPQRSGTTLGAKILAEMLNYEHLDEHSFGTHYFDNFLRKIKNKTNFVIQCPGLSHKIIDFPLEDDGIVVFMKRDIFDIISSEYRINWWEKGPNLSGPLERKKYQQSFPEYYKQFIPISVLKYKVWNDVQKLKIKNYLEIDYEILKESNLWIDKSKRKNFTSKQIK